MKLFQPYSNVSIDERMVRMIKADILSTVHQRQAYIMVNEAVCLLQATFNFEVYTGKTGNVPTLWLAYPIVFRLTQMLFGQG